MSDELNEHSEDELDLGDTEGDESLDTDGASTTEDHESESEDEESQEALNLEEDKGTTSQRKVEVRDKQVAAWVSKIESGQKGIEDLPKSQLWLKSHIEKALKPKASVDDIEALVDRKLAEKEAARGFQSLQEELRNVKLTKAQREAIQSEYKDFRAEGISKVKALQAAIKVAGVDVSSDRVNKLRSDMALPRSGAYRDGREGIDEDNWRQKLSAEERVKKLKEMSESF